MERMKEKSKIKEKKEKEKAKYGMWSNSCYMVGHAWRGCRSVLLLIGVMAGLEVTKSLLQLFVVPVILGRIEAAVPLTKLVGTILLFTLGLIVTGALSTYVGQNQLYGRITVRMNIIRDMHNKVNLTSYPNTEEQEFINLREKAKRANL